MSDNKIIIVGNPGPPTAFEEKIKSELGKREPSWRNFEYEGLSRDDLLKKIYHLETELKQLKRGFNPEMDDWANMTGAKLNEEKYRQFKNNLVAHKKLTQIVAGYLGGASDGISNQECLALADLLDPFYHNYLGLRAVRKLKKDIERLRADETRTEG